MLIVNKKPFFRGILMLVSFFAVFVALLLPLFPDMDNPGKKLTGLHFADSVFNSLAKGSSYFIPAVTEQIAPLADTQVSLTIPVKSPQMLPFAQKILEKTGMQVSTTQNTLTYAGTLGPLLQEVLNISDSMYYNDGKSIEQNYNVTNALQISNACWDILQPSIKALQKQGKIKEAAIIDTVVRRAIEPAHNFYSVQATSVKEHLVLMSGLLLFYLLYTMWYGFGIFEFFEGIGLTMSKSKVKQEG